MTHPTRCTLFVLLYVWVSAGCGTVRKIFPGRDTSPPVTVSAGSGGASLGIPVPGDAHPALISEIAGWKGTPYLWGGNTRSGVDCSGFINRIFPVVYGVQVPRTTRDLFSFSKPLRENLLKQGDLVFFSVESGFPTHAGIYLWDGYFAHASTSRGVIISRLQEIYWNARFFRGGCILQGSLHRNWH